MKSWTQTLNGGTFSCWLRAFFLGALLMQACTPAPETQFSRENNELSVLEIPPETFHGPEEFENFVKLSQVKFEWISYPQPLAEDWSKQLEPKEPDPYTHVFQKGNARRVYIDAPPAWMLQYYTEGERRGIVDKNLSEARKILNRAIVSAPEYFKSYTIYGKVLVQAERWTEAKPFLEKALTLNPLDWEASYYLGRSYQGLMDYDQALFHLSKAYMLNRYNPQLSQTLMFLLQGKAMEIRKNRITFPFRIRELSLVPQRFGIEIEKGYERWLKPMAACLALWKYDADYPETILAGLSDPAGIMPYRECLTIHAASLKEALRDLGPQALPENQKYLLAKLEDRQLEAVVLWEIIGSRDPYLMYLLHEDQRTKIHQYILKWVLMYREQKRTGQ